MIQNTVFFITVFMAFSQCYSSMKKYYNYTLYRGVPINEGHLLFFKNLSQFEVNFWSDIGKLNKPIDFMVHPRDKDLIRRAAEEKGLNLTIIMQDVQQAFDQQTIKPYTSRRTESFNWEHYFKIDDIYNWLKDLSSQYKDIMKLRSIGKTAEKRDILAVTIAFHGADTRPKVIVEGGIHAREWISPAFVTYMINQIVHASYSDNVILREIAMMYEWYFVPVINPDGYQYSHTHDRLWRKNRHDGYGVDLNRNFGYNFGTVGVSYRKNSETYCGPAAFSEAETRAMGDFVRSNSRNLIYYFSFHSYGQYMIIPYADKRDHLENFDEVKTIGKIAADKIASRYNTRYTLGTAYDTVGYLTSGVSGCWVKSTFGVRTVIIFELRDKGRHGFALPANQIKPTCQETMDGVLSLLTSRSTEELKKMREIYLIDGQSRTPLDDIVIICNVFLFIIVRFD